MTCPVAWLQSVLLNFVEQDIVKFQLFYIFVIFHPIRKWCSINYAVVSVIPCNCIRFSKPVKVLLHFADLLCV